MKNPIATHTSPILNHHVCHHQGWTMIKQAISLVSHMPSLLVDRTYKC